MIVQNQQVPVPRGEVELSVFAWDRGDAGPALIEQIRGAADEEPRYLVTRFIGAQPTATGAKIVLGAAQRDGR